MKSVFENQRMSDADPVRLHWMLLPIAEVAHLQHRKHDRRERAHVWVEEVGHPRSRMAGCHFLALKRQRHGWKPCNRWSIVPIMCLFVFSTKSFDFSSSEALSQNSGARFRLSRQLAARAGRCSVFFKWCNVLNLQCFPMMQYFGDVFDKTSISMFFKMFFQRQSIAQTPNNVHCLPLPKTQVAANNGEMILWQ